MSAMRTILAALLTLLASIGPAHAASMLDPLLGSPGDCYYRAYDAAHLRANSQQRVTAIGVKYNDRYQDPNEELTLALAFTLRNGETYTVTGLCRGNVCGAEGDGGAFTVTRARDGIRLTVDPQRGLGAEGKRDHSGDLYESDDKVFLLYPARPAACDWQP